MAQLSKHHQKLNEEGIGKCSVPMWSGGCPAGFCDNDAYGERPKSVEHRTASGEIWREDGKYSGYVPALACPAHGGPVSRVFMDGTAWCAVMPDFKCLQESPAGFGNSPEEARASLAEELMSERTAHEPR